MHSARLALSSDVPRLGQLAELAINELSQSKGGDVWVRREARARPPGVSIAAALDRGHHLVLAGTYDSVVVGYAVVGVETLADGGALGIIEDLYVEPDAREVGVGEAMMDMILEWCADRGCFGVDALALPGDRGTKNFFETYGLVARSIVVHRALDR